MILNGTRVAGQPPTLPPRGERQRFGHLMLSGRPAFADDPTLDLPCQDPAVDPDMWFANGTGKEHQAARTEAIRLCRTCPMQTACRSHAAAEPRELYGIWGGQLFEKLNRPGNSQRKGAGSS